MKQVQRGQSQLNVHTSDERLSVSSRMSDRAGYVPYDGIRELHTLQAQMLQTPAATDDALQSRGWDDGVGQIQLHYLQEAEAPKIQQRKIVFVFLNLPLSGEGNV